MAVLKQREDIVEKLYAETLPDDVWEVNNS